MVNGAEQLDIHIKKKKIKEKRKKQKKQTLNPLQKYIQSGL